MKKRVLVTKAKPITREKIKNWKPWRLEERSVATGKNLHLRILKGYAPPEFKQWVKQLAEDYHVKESDVWIGITESLRRAEWEVINHNSENKGFRRISIPFITVGEHPSVSGSIFDRELFYSRKAKKASDQLFSIEAAIESLSEEDRSFVRKRLQQHRFGKTALGSLLWLPTLASSSQQLVNLDQELVARGIEQLISGKKVNAIKYLSDSNRLKLLLTAIAREVSFIALPTRSEMQNELKKYNKSYFGRLIRVFIIENKHISRTQKDNLKVLMQKQDEIFEPLMRRLKIRN
ncbi:MAG: hypothetical protein Q7S21_06760 [archaeon]|nr:hypothetical protein [archaeon]